MNRRDVLLTGSAAGLLAGCGLRDGIGREETRPLEGGIGGTGIVGLLSGFGSLIINGMRVEVDSQTQYFDGYGPVGSSAVNIGDALTIEAITVGGELLAKTVQVLHPVIGVLELISSDGKLARVNGIYIDIPRPRGGFKVGDRVAVSGIWNINRVLASQMSKAPSSDDIISGEITRGQSTTPAFIGSTRLRGVRKRAALVRDSFAIVRGRYDLRTGEMHSTRLRPGRFTGVGGGITRLSIDGILVPSYQAPYIKVSGLGHSFSKDTDLSYLRDSRVLIDGRYDGKLRPLEVKKK